MRSGPDQEMNEIGRLVKELSQNMSRKKGHRRFLGGTIL